MKKNSILLCVIGAVLVLGAVVWMMQGRSGVEDNQEEQAPKTKAKSTARKLRKPKVKAGAAKGTKQAGNRRKKAAADHVFSKKDEALIAAVQDALDAEDFARTVRAAEAALKSADPQVRLEAVEALGWFDEKALPELTSCMADPDEEVAEAARDHWEGALSLVESPRERASIATMALGTITDTDSLTMIGSQFTNAATEIIDGAENESAMSKARVEFVQFVVDMINSDKKAQSTVAREMYEDLTGNTWINVEEAEKYLRDPDNYEPPDEGV